MPNRGWFNKKFITFQRVEAKIVTRVLGWFKEKLKFD